MSNDGRYVSFVSNAMDLVPGKRDATVDVFIHDLHTRTTTLVSASPTGEGGNGDSSLASISADGTTVAFFSGASNLVSGDGNDKNDVFVFERPE
jgi:Tol biopolymer transport system component